MTLPAITALPWRPVRRYLAVMAAGNLVWEIAHLPLYTIWLTGTVGEIAYAVLHCTGGDVLIATTTLGIALLLAGRRWPLLGRRKVVALTILFAVAYTVFSEWLNISVRGSWAYRDLMPRLPPFGTGLTPLLQWIVLPWIAFLWALKPMTARG